MKRAWLILILAAAASACATFSPAYKLGNQAEISRDWDAAIRQYERAVVENPREPVYRMALLRVRASAGLAALQKARLLAAEGKTDDAAAAYRQALTYDPTNRQAARELKILTAPPEAAAPAVEEAGPPRLKVPDETLQLKFTDAMLRSIFQALGRAAGVNFLYDETFRDLPLTIDLSDRTFEQAIAYLCMASKHFHRVIDERTVIVVPDNPMKRMQYELNGIQTFYLSNINAQDVQNSLAMMIRTQYKAPTLIIDKTLNSVTIRDTPQVVTLAERLLKAWDRSPGEVVVDLEIMEVSRVKMKKLGLELSEYGVGVRFNNADAAADEGWFNLGSLGLTSRANYDVTLPGAFLQFLESDSDTKTIAQPRLRGVASEEIVYNVGQKVPLISAQFAAIAAGGIQSQPITSYTYQDVGILVKITPRIHMEGEITLDMDIKISSIGGTGVAGIPILLTREVKNVMRLKDGETNLLAGLLRDDERQSLKGIAGIKDIPLLGSLFSSSDKTVEQTDLILTVTPYIIRGVPLNEAGDRPIWVDPEGMASAGGGGGMMPPGQIAPMPPFPGARRPGLPGEPAGEAPGGDMILLNPPSFEVPAEREFRLSVEAVSGSEIGSLSLNVQFNPQLLRLKEVVEGGMAAFGGEKAAFLQSIDNDSGVCTLGITSPEIGKGLGSGALAVLVFESLAPGETEITVAGIMGNQPNGQPIPFSSRPAKIFIR